MPLGETILLEKTAKCDVALDAFTVVKMGSDDDHVAIAEGRLVVMVGIVQHATSAAEEECRIGLAGISRLKIGTTVTRGDYLTTEALGRGVPATPGPGSNWNVIGIALQSGVSGDVIKVALKQGRIQGA